MFNSICTWPTTIEPCAETSTPPSVRPKAGPMMSSPAVLPPVELLVSVISTTHQSPRLTTLWLTVPEVETTEVAPVWVLSATLRTTVVPPVIWTLT